MRIKAASVSTSIAALLLLASLAPAWAAMPPSVEEPQAPPPRRVGLREHVVVTATRLPGPEVKQPDVPAHVTVIDRRRIEASGARTIQELLAFEAGVSLHDQTGSGRQDTLDMRGFSRGTGMAVYLEGARLNDPRNNQVALELIPIDAVDRIEIIRGATSSLAGGGAEAGLIQIFLRTGETKGGGVSMASGTHGALDAAGAAQWRWRKAGGFASASLDRTDGFRENSEADEKRLAATAGVELAGGRRLSVSLVSASLDLGNPGSLTEAEFARNPAAAPFNQSDGMEEDLGLFSMNFQGPVAAGFSLAANLSYRDSRAEVLTTGRGASLFGGFFLDSDTRVAGAALQASHHGLLAGRGNDVSLGAEWMDGDTGALGFFTAPSDPAHVDRSSPDTHSDARRRTLALFAREAWKPFPKWGLTAGVRFDSDRFGYDERIPDPSNGDSRSFSEVSLSAGVTWQPRDETGFYLSYGEAFLPPTVEQLFAFPGFGSNPGLVPQDSRSLQAGVRVNRQWTKRSLDLDAAIFRVATDDEIVFRPGPLPGAPFGRNENQGRTLRRGVELSVRSRLAARITGFINATWTEAQIRNDPNRGNTVPLVPRDQISAGMDLTLPAGLAIRADALRVGDQVLDNDDANEQDRLSSYATANLRIAWRPAAARRKPGDSAGEDARGPSVFLEAKNLFDRNYATRGIYAFDYGSSSNAVFLTPAPGRRYLAGGEWKF